MISALFDSVFGLIFGALIFCGILGGGAYLACHATLDPLKKKMEKFLEDFPLYKKL